MSTTIIQLGHAVGTKYPYYANINGITKSSITCYFDQDANLAATTLHTGGPKQEALLQKVKDFIALSEIRFPAEQDNI